MRARDGELGGDGSGGGESDVGGAWDRCHGEGGGEFGEVCVGGYAIIMVWRGI